jgi:hypothetical protein
VKKTTRKPFVAPQIKEEASLVGVTLVSGGNTPRRFGKKGGHNTRHGGQRHGGRDS